MEEPPTPDTAPAPVPRRRIQVHLSTAIVLMFAAGALMWANMRRQDWKTPSGPVTFEMGGRTVSSDSVPLDMSMMDDRVREVLNTQLGLYSTTFAFDFSGWPCLHYLHWESDPYDNISGAKWYYGRLAANIGVAAAILVAAAFVCEWLVRRQDRRAAGGDH